MIDNTMPERIYAGAWPGYWYPTAQPLTTQYIRADVAQAQLDAANARIAELEAAQRPRPVTEDMHTDWWGRVLAYDIIDKTWHEVAWEDEIDEGRSRGLSHWMPLPPPPVTEVTNENS